MHGRKRIIVAAAVVAASVLIGTGAVLQSVGAEPAGDSDFGDSEADETETPITGEALTRASEAALAVTGGGTVTGTEVGDEESYYEVEVTLPDGTEVDIQLDETFAVVGQD